MIEVFDQKSLDDACIGDDVICIKFGSREAPAKVYDCDCDFVIGDSCVVSVVGMVNVHAVEHATVIAYGDCMVFADGHCTIESHDLSSVFVSGECVVHAMDWSSVRACGNCAVLAKDNTTVFLSSKAKVTKSDSSVQVFALGG